MWNRNVAPESVRTYPIKNRTLFIKKAYVPTLILIITSKIKDSQLYNKLKSVRTYPEENRNTSTKSVHTYPENNVPQKTVCYVPS